MSGKDFTRDIFLWLRQVCADRDIPHSSFRLAFVIAQHINRRKLVAWPTQRTLAAQIGISERETRRLLDQLRQRGHLNIDVGHGPGHASEYRTLHKTGHQLPLFENENRTPASGIDRPKPDIFDSKTGHQLPVKTGHQCPTNNLIQQSEEHSDSIGDSDSPHATTKKARGRQQKDDESFSEFWRAYPLHKGKLAATRAFAQAIKRGDGTAAEIIAGAQRYAAERAGQDQRFTKHPTTWLHAGGWMDEAPRPNGGGPVIDQHGNLIEQQPQQKPANNSWKEKAAARIAERHRDEHR